MKKIRDFILKCCNFWTGQCSHFHRRIESGPFRGYWTVYCPDCDRYWDEPVDGTFPRENWIKFRPHMGGFIESVNRSVDLEATKEELVKYINTMPEFINSGIHLISSDIGVEFYAHDDRDRKWHNTYVVTGLLSPESKPFVIGFVNGQVE